MATYNLRLNTASDGPNAWPRFRDVQTKQEFCFFSVHFDHEGVVAHREPGRLMAGRIALIAGNAPVICAGDFNSTPNTE